MLFLQQFLLLYHIFIGLSILVLPPDSFWSKKRDKPSIYYTAHASKMQGHHANFKNRPKIS
jgi:hypothetical protein